MDIINEFDKEFVLDPSPLSFSFVYNSFNYLSEIITPNGLCTTFNMAYFFDMLDINTTSDDFHFQLFKTGWGIEYIPILPRNDSQFPYGSKLHAVFPENLKDISIKNDIDGYQLYLHDPFELPSSFSVKYLVRKNQGLDFNIIPQINMIDDSIIDYKPNE